ncbi:MAG: hypothetical protein KF712_04085 [Akkermansiaceae bacterium]|nr:hypothetical protein [Akkermansiaceae bacterium]
MPTFKPDARILTGIDHWCATVGVDPDNGLTIVASVLGGLAGPAGYIDHPCGMEELPSLHLVVPATQGMLPHAVNLLFSPARRINRQILETMAGINPAALRYISHASFAGDPEKARPQDNIESVMLRDLRRGPAFDRDTNHVANGEGDLNPDPIQRRVEAITRPALMLESPALADISKLLPGCHLSHALGADIPLHALISSPKRKKEVDQFLRLMNGTEILMPSPKYPVGVEHNRPARLQAIFRADTTTLRQLVPDIIPLLERSLLLVNTSTTTRSDPVASYFSELFGRTTTRIALLRRNGMPLVAKFATSEAASRFQLEFSRFIATCDSSPAPVGSSIRNLPQSMVWALMMLGQHMKQYQPPGDDEVITAVFDASHNLLRRHCQQVEELVHAAELDELIRRARKIVRKIQEKQLISFSGLVRTFDQQRTSLYRPVVDVLVEAEVLDRQPDGRLRLGNRSFDEALPSLSFSFLNDR